MRMSKSFSQTLREAPANVDADSHRLLLRAGFIRQLSAGIFSYLPFAQRAMSKIENIMREEINAIGGQEIKMPVVQPADIWKETKRWHHIGSEMGQFLDKSGHDMVLAMTHEEALGDLARQEIRSYRQMPQLLYHLQTKWRDDPRPRAGLIRVREFTMLDSYSLDADTEGLIVQYQNHYRAYLRIFARCGLPALAVNADVGMMGGQVAHEFMYLSSIGEDTVLLCDRCGYTANRQVATFNKPQAQKEDALLLQKVATPDTTTISALAQYLSIPASRTAKAMFMMATFVEGINQTTKFVLAIIRGDLDINETKLSNAVKARDMRPATLEEIQAINAVPGYGSPIGVRNAIVVADDSVVSSPNLVTGANEQGYHFLNSNYGRDYVAGITADIAAAAVGFACKTCNHPLRVSRGIEIGNIFQLGTRYSDALGCMYLDAEGRSKPVVMGSYGIGVGRLLACIAEEHHDERGLCLPVTVAPYQVYLALLGNDDSTRNIAEKLYDELTSAGVEVLYDDRDARPGVKFADADLIGAPIRLTVAERGLKRGGVEMKHRQASDNILIPLADVVQRVIVEINTLIESSKTAALKAGNANANIS